MTDTPAEHEEPRDGSDAGGASHDTPTGSGGEWHDAAEQDAAPDEPASSPSEPVATRSRRARALVIGAVAVVVVVAGVVVVTLRSTPNADAAIITAVNSTLGEKTAHLDMSGSVNAAGQSAQFNGSGSIDFTQNAMQIEEHASVAGQQVTIAAVYLGGTVYENLPQLSQVAPGKSWISMDVSSLSSAGGAGSAGSLGSNPLAGLHLLAQEGNAVTSLGTSTIDGQTVDGYSVTIDPATAERKLKAANLPDWMRQAASKITMGSGSEQVYLSTSGALVRIVMSVDEGVSGAGSVTVRMAYDFSDLGAPVSIEAPPQDQVVPFDQFLQLAKGSSTA